MFHEILKLWKSRMGNINPQNVSQNRKMLILKLWKSRMGNINPQNVSQNRKCFMKLAKNKIKIEFIVS
jgi:hypothetical protein